MGTKLTKGAVKKAMKKANPTYIGLADVLGVCTMTVKRFMWDPKNQDVYDLFKEKRLDIDKAAHSIIEDAIQNGCVKTAKWWEDYRRKVREHEEGKKLNVDGDLGIEITIVRKDDENKD